MLYALYRRRERKKEAKGGAVSLAIVLFSCVVDATRRHCSSDFVLYDLGQNIDFNRSIYGIQSNADPPREAEQHLLARSCTPRAWFCSFHRRSPWFSIRSIFLHTSRYTYGKSIFFNPRLKGLFLLGTMNKTFQPIVFDFFITLNFMRFRSAEFRFHHFSPFN